MNTWSNLYRPVMCVVMAMSNAAAVAQRAPDDHGNDPSTATDLNLGETATGEVYGIDEDYFRFDLPRRTTVVLSGTGPASTMLLRMNGESETCLAIHSHGFDATRRELPEGTYHLRVSGAGEQGVYETAVHEAAPDDHGGVPETATELPVGASVGGEIETAGDTDFFRIELSERATLEFFGVGVETSQAGICEPEPRLFYFALADGDGDGDRGWNRFELEPGTYYVGVRSRGLQGPYEIGVRDAGSDDHGDSRASATHLALGQPATGGIGPHGDADYYRFDLPRAMDVTVTADADAGLYFTLLDENGRRATDENGVNFRKDDDGQGGLRLRGDLIAGRYYLRMLAWPNVEERPIRNYEVLVRETPPDDHGNTEAEATALVLGDAAAGGIDPHDDMDYFRLDLQQRTTVDVALTGDAEFGPFGTLIDADGEVLSTSESIPGRSELQLRADLDPGAYYVAVYAYRTTERYEIVAREAEPDDHGDRPDTATAIAPGGMAEGAVDRSDDVDYFRLDLARPSILAVSVTSDFDNVELGLFDAAGALLQEGYGLARTDLRTRAELEPGTYYVSVASYMSVNSYSYAYRDYCSPPRNARYTGRYRLSVWGDVPPDDHGGLAVTATDLRPDTAARGDIDPREDRDVFRLELARPSDVVVDVAGGFPLLARVFDADGEEVEPEVLPEEPHPILREITILTEACNDWTMEFVQPDSEAEELQMRFEAQPGVYYLELSSEGGAGWYEIAVREPEDF